MGFLFVFVFFFFSIRYLRKRSGFLYACFITSHISQGVGIFAETHLARRRDTYFERKVSLNWIAHLKNINDAIFLVLVFRIKRSRSVER